MEWNVHYFIARGCRKRGDAVPDAGERISVRLFEPAAFIEAMTVRGRDDGAFTADMLRLRYEKNARSALLALFEQDV